jgi:hypothetical protein
MRIIRGERSRQIVFGPWENRGEQTNQQDVMHILTDEGGIETYRTGTQHAAFCGCLRPPAGHCGKCMRTACALCFGCCAQCSMPLCNRCSYFPAGAIHREFRLCSSCHQNARRKRIVRTLSKALLSPFIKFESSDEKR